MGRLPRFRRCSRNARSHKTDGRACADSKRRAGNGCEGMRERKLSLGRVLDSITTDGLSPSESTCPDTMT